MPAGAPAERAATLPGASPVPKGLPPGRPAAYTETSTGAARQFAERARALGCGHPTLCSRWPAGHPHICRADTEIQVLD